MYTLFNWTNFCFLSTKEMLSFLSLLFFLKKEKFVFDHQKWKLAVSRSTLVESFHCEQSPVIELGYGQPLGAELSVKYIFKKNFFATYDASDRRSYTLLSYFARAAFNYPALYATVLYGEVLASFTNYVFVFFHDFELFDQPPPFPLRRTKHRYIPLYAL